MSITDYYRVYYSQNREDIILSVFLDSIDKGFYVDVGSGDPVNDSVTNYFYQRGWQGINIEPNKTIYKRLNARRKRDININVGISDKGGKRTLRIYQDEMQGQSTYSKKIKLQKAKEDSSLAYEDVLTDVRTLNSVLKENIPKDRKDIHFMKIDVEGFEGEVLHGNDWNVFRPWVLCIEADHLHEDWRSYLAKNGYEKKFSDGLNDYFVENEHTYLFKNFESRYVKFVIENEKPFLHDRVIEQFKLLEENNNNLNKKLQQLNRKKAELKEQLEMYKSIRVTSKHLYELIRRNVRDRLD